MHGQYKNVTIKFENKLCLNRSVWFKDWQKTKPGLYKPLINCNYVNPFCSFNHKCIFKIKNKKKKIAVGTEPTTLQTHTMSTPTFILTF